MSAEHHEVAIIGAGPIGIELAIALKKAGIDYVQIEKGQIAQTITWFPHLMKFFTSSDRIGISGVPIPRTDESRCSREDFLAYLRGVVLQFDLKINTFENVTSLTKDSGVFTIKTDHKGTMRTYTANSVVLATGGTDMPNLLNIPGEDLPHVSHYFDEPHRYFRQRVLVVGGRNSAVEAAIRCHRCGADVTLSHRQQRIDPKTVKYWILPELKGFVERGEITMHNETVPVEIRPESVLLKNLADDSILEVPADFVLLMVGYLADMSLFKMAGVTLINHGKTPVFNEQTMETDVPSLYIAGTAIAGSQQTYNVFMENCHVHIDRILASLTGSSHTSEDVEYKHPES